MWACACAAADGRDAAADPSGALHRHATTPVPGAPARRLGRSMGTHLGHDGHGRAPGAAQPLRRTGPPAPAGIPSPSTSPITPTSSPRRSVRPGRAWRSPRWSRRCSAGSQRIADWRRCAGSPRPRATLRRASRRAPGCARRARRGARPRQALNGMLARLETAFRRLSDYSADIAHGCARRSPT